MSSVNTSLRVQIPSQETRTHDDVDPAGGTSAKHHLAVAQPVAIGNGEAVLPLESLPPEALILTADDLSSKDRALFARTSKFVHAAVTQGAQDPVTDAVYKAQAHFRALRLAGVTGPPLEEARAHVRAAVALGTKRQALQRWADQIPNEPWEIASGMLTAVFQYSKSAELLTNVLRDHPNNPRALHQLARTQSLMGNYAAARATATELDRRGPLLAVSTQILLTELSLLEANIDGLDGEAPMEPGANWALYSAVAELKARQAVGRGEADQAREWRAKVSDRISDAAHDDPDLDVAWFHAATGDPRAALDYVKAANLDRVLWQCPELAPLVIGPGVADEAARHDWLEYLRPRLESPEQLATIRIPDNATIPNYVARRRAI